MSLFSQRFKMLKESSGLTLRDLAETFHISVPTLSYYMNGREPSYDLLIEIAHFFGVTTDWLIGATDAKDSLQELISEDVKNTVSSKRDLILHNQLLDVEDQIDFIAEHDNVKVNSGQIENSLLTGTDKELYLQLQKQLYQTMDEVYYSLTNFSDPTLHKYKDAFFKVIKLLIKNFYQFFYSISTFSASLAIEPITYKKAISFLKNCELYTELEEKLLLHIGYLFTYEILSDLEDHSTLLKTSWTNDEKRVFNSLLDFNYDKINISYSISYLENLSQILHTNLIDQLKLLYDYLSEDEIIQMASLF